MLSIFKTFKEADAKLLVNSFIGTLGKKYRTKSQSAICTDMGSAAALYYFYSEKENTICNISKFNNIYIVKTKHRTYRNTNYLPINRQIVHMASIMIDKLIRRTNSPVYAIYTDAVYFKHDLEFETNEETIGGILASTTKAKKMIRVLAKVEDFPPLDTTSDDWKPVDTSHIIGSKVIEGPGGSGKTYHAIRTCMKQYVSGGKKCIALSTSHKSVQVIKSLCQGSGFRGRCKNICCILWI